MTHASQKGSLSRCQSLGRDHARGWSYGEAMGRAWPERFLKEAGARKGQSKEPKEAKGEADRKHYPLRGRGGTLEDEALSSPVRKLLRSQASARRVKEQRECRGKPTARNSNSEPSGSTCKADQVSSDVKATPKVQTQGPPPALEPRKRRLASLNAEAVNSLLLEKAEVAPATKVAKKNLQEGPPGGECSLTADAAAQDSSTGKPHTCQSPKQPQQQHSKKPKPTEKDVVDLSLFAPTPRRLAGLNAAALLKLTSTSAASKQRVKVDGKSAGATATKKVASTRTHTQTTAAKKQLEAAGRKDPPALSPGSGCFSCKKGGFEPSAPWERAVEEHRLAKPGYQPGSVPEYPLKQVKEEQVEAELSPYCCCGPPGSSLDYCCHRLELYLRQQPGYPEAGEGPFAAVKQECLVPPPPPPSLAHPALTLSTHPPCLCFPSYYVHMAHPRAPSIAGLGSQPLPFAPSALCSGPVSGPKLLAPGMAHSSGIPHPPFCASVRSPCFSEACRVSSYSYRALQPMATRGCSFSTGCSRCRQEIKTEGYSSPRREHSPSLLQVAPAVPLSACPLPQVTPSTASVPHVLSPRSERMPAEAVVGSSGRECPQGSKPSDGSLSARHARPSHKPQAPAAATTAKQKKVVRRRATNGWRPIGVPVEKEVFVVGEDEPALRQCFEGVRRAGDEIRVRDTVLLRSGPRKKSQPYVAKVSALWEDPKTGELMMSLFWYYRPEHTQGGKDPNMHCENEIFASKHQDVNSVACIEDKCYVLPLAQYCRYCALVKRRTEGLPEGPPLVPCPADTTPPLHRRVPPDADPELVFLCRHVYDFRYGRILKNLQ